MCAAMPTDAELYARALDVLRAPDEECVLASELPALVTGAPSPELYFELHNVVVRIRNEKPAAQLRDGNQAAFISRVYASVLGVPFLSDKTEQGALAKTVGNRAAAFAKASGKQLKCLRMQKTRKRAAHNSPTVEAQPERIPLLAIDTTTLNRLSRPAGRLTLRLSSMPPASPWPPLSTVCHQRRSADDACMPPLSHQPATRGAKCAARRAHNLGRERAAASCVLG